MGSKQRIFIAYGIYVAIEDRPGNRCSTVPLSQGTDLSAASASDGKQRRATDYTRSPIGRPCGLVAEVLYRLNALACPVRSMMVGPAKVLDPKGRLSSGARHCAHAPMIRSVVVEQQCTAVDAG
jgi:hypothetical protein